VVVGRGCRYRRPLRSFLPVLSYRCAWCCSSRRTSRPVLPERRHPGPRPEGKAAAVGAARFTANLTSLSVRFLAGLAFAAALAPAASFWLLGGGILAVAGAQLWTARKLAALSAAGAVASLSPVHGLPGRLIVVEGLDGSGKSTQMEMLKEELEAKGLKVVVTTWNSSDMVSEAVKKAKKDQSLTPKTSLLHARIWPTARRPSFPRWRKARSCCHQALARDRVRGMDARWLRRLYAFAPKPDLTLYYRLPVETAIGRVLARSEGKLGLSEDYADDNEAARLSQERRGLKFYEAGLDTGLSADPIENFHLFQTRVSAEYDAQAREFGFKTINSSRSRDAIRADTMAAAFGALGALAAFRKAEKPEAKSNLFDKDPAGDAGNIRRNYLHEKRGAHFYFRNMLLPMQARFAELLDMSSTPRALLHGSPHVDNYAKSAQGAAMVDFDRSRVGPYSWDLVRHGLAFPPSEEGREGSSRQGGPQTAEERLPARVPPPRSSLFRSERVEGHRARGRRDEHERLSQGEQEVGQGDAPQRASGGRRRRGRARGQLGRGPRRRRPQ
jgi:dTMP kinase